VQYFDDGPVKDGRKALATPHFDALEARRKQQDGCGVFFSPNSFDGMRRTENLRYVQAAYIDVDLKREKEPVTEAEFRERLTAALADLQACPLPPHAVIRTKNGLQAVWRVEPLPPAQGLPLFQETVDLLIRQFRADPAARDVTRVLRLPGFLHLKNPAEPFPCTLLHGDVAAQPHRLAELRDALRPWSPPSAAPAPAQVPAKTWAKALPGVAAGERNQAAVVVAGKLLCHLPEELWETAGWGGHREWNGRNTPPLPERELRRVFDSVARRERGKRVAPARENDDSSARSQADKLVALATQEQAVFFLDQFGCAHVSVQVRDHCEQWRVRSKVMRMWLCSLLWRSEARAPSPIALTSALTALEGRAYFASRRIALHNRVAWHEGALWYDLTNEHWEAVRVTGEGWTVERNVPVLFHRHTHAEPQCQPKPGGDARALLRFANVPDPEQRVLLLVYLASCFLPDIPHPLALFYGPHGSAKTTLARMLRRLIDPSAVPVLALPQSLPALVQQLSHHWFACYDNVSGLPEWASDALCRAVTGEGFSKRELYSDDEDVLYAFRRCVGLNGINVAARKADLLDRSLLFLLGKMSGQERRSERSLWADFERALPGILGGVFDALSAALRLHPKVSLAGTPRMADFAEWGHALAEGLGFRPDEFASAYRHNQREQHEEAINENVVALAVTVFMRDHDFWEGSPADLLRCLAKVAEREHISTKSALWPALPNALVRRLNEARGNLAEVGVIFDSRKASRGRRVIRLQRLAEPAVVAPPQGPPAVQCPPPTDARGGDEWRCHRHPGTAVQKP
jgi:hypothetical protein